MSFSGSGDEELKFLATRQDEERRGKFPEWIEFRRASRPPRHDLSVFPKALVDLCQGNFERSRTRLCGKSGGDASSLAHAHARGLDAETEVREAIAADATAGHDEVAAAFGNEGAQGNRRDDPGLERLGFDTFASVQVDGIKGVGDRVIEEATRGVVIHRDHRLSLDAIALAEAGLGLEVHEALIVLTHLFEDGFATGKIRLGRRARVR